MDKMPWFAQYCEDAERTDQLVDHRKHVELLAAGLFGETGSILAELKKKDREKRAYPFDRERLEEEIGDVLWYLSRLIGILAPSEATKLDDSAARAEQQNGDDLANAIALGSAVGAMLDTLREDSGNDASQRLGAIWRALGQVSAGLKIGLRDAACRNRRKTQSRWPCERRSITLFDDQFPEEEQIPRKLNVEFREIKRDDKPAVILRCNGINLGDRLTDNIGADDGYRFHDVFHFAHAVYLGWSPISRGLLKCKRKSNPAIDENEDGARAGIIEEAVSAIVFSQAKETRFYDGIDHVDYHLLKTIQGFVKGFEVDSVPLWQWEEAILNGYRVFRELRRHRGGKLTLDLFNRDLRYEAPS